MLVSSGQDADDRAAVRLFKRSLASAAKLDAIGWELRTAISLAHLLKDGSDSARTKARDLLASTRRKFAAGETSADLRKADQLLHELAD